MKKQNWTNYGMRQIKGDFFEETFKIGIGIKYK